MDNHDLLLERQNRILDTIKGNKPDRTPIIFQGDMALARYVNPELTFKDYCTDHRVFGRTLVEQVLPKFPACDAIFAVGSNPRNAGSTFQVKTLVPGRELGDNEMYQYVFDHWMTEDDYDVIIDKGWKAFCDYHTYERLKYDPEDMALVRSQNAEERKMFYDAGFPFTDKGMLSGPYDSLAFNRGTDFFIDLLEIPEKVHAAMEVILEEDFAMQGPMIDKLVADHAEKGEAYMCSVAPCVQANCSLLSRELFEEFGWPLIERQANFLIEHGAYIHFHMDANWTNNLDLFATLPPNTAMIDTDGNTDLEKVRDILGDRMAFTGYVLADAMAFETPDKIYDIVRDQIATMGDRYIASSACTLPAFTPPENIDAFYAAIMDAQA